MSIRGKRSRSATTSSIAMVLIGHREEQVAGLAEAHRLALGDRPPADAEWVGVAGGDQLLLESEAAADDEAEY